MRKRQGRLSVVPNLPKQFLETSNRYRLLVIPPHPALAAVTGGELRLCTQEGVLDDLEWVGPVC